ncbi:MAG: hypothetical protein B6226_00395 [Candidatus Cloacimonetes bacterium 4572_65]|nr:MAG: hypothetical protein B6226_00395 [Candidatus Cloacimonetes bacterium 4572_65]
MYNSEADKEKIKEFLYLIENEKIDLRRFTRPVLVWIVKDQKVGYTIWEEDLLKRFGLENVDGWDYDEDISFAPDWILGDDEFDDDDDDDDDYLLKGL